jgi:intein-encoded DNA endonuclease-like protein
LAEVGTFPFGWVRGFKDDNWQIIWDPKSNLIVAQGALSKKVIELGRSSQWMDAKKYADNVMRDPESFFG